MQKHFYYRRINMERENKQYSCSFFGHRKIDKTPELTQRLKQEVETLIAEKEVTDFYFGSRSQFNDLCLEVVTHLKEKYPHIKRIYVRSAFPNISEDYKDFLLESYDKTYFPEKIKGAGKASYVERNQEMIDNTSFALSTMMKAMLRRRE